MPVIDPSTPIGKMRLRVGDWADLPWLPDSVYQSTLTENNDNIVRASGVIAQYILAMLTRNTKTKLAQLESYDNQAFEQYKEFLMLTTTNPAFMSINPLVQGNVSGEDNPLVKFQKYWNAGYVAGTSYDDMAMYYGDTPNGKGGWSDGS